MAGFSPKPMEKPNFAEFNQWAERFKLRAAQYGIDPDVYNSALKGQKPDAEVIRLDRLQFKPQTLEEYLNRVITTERINRARKLYRQNKKLLHEIYNNSGVEPEFIVALWGLESNFGDNQGGFSVVNALATLAYEGRRREFFEKELLKALKILQEGHVKPSDFKGSWAGAMGQCQFMPSSFFAYAVDYDFDGKRDIWGNRKDVFASIANYLKTVGWGKSRERKEKSLMHWNKSTYFVTSVFTLASEIR